MSAVVILNCIPVRKGGGLQKVSSFFESLLSYSGPHKFIALVSEDSGLAKFAEKANIDVILIKRGYHARLIAEINCRKFAPKGSICFTLSGPPMLGSLGYYNNIAECAYSNLFYPEINFWKYESLLNQVIKKAVDYYRFNMLLNCNSVIFQTSDIHTRAVSIFGFSPYRTFVVRPSYRLGASGSLISDSAALKIDSLPANSVLLLFLASAHPNKRIDLAAGISQHLELLLKRNVYVVTTMDERHAYFSIVNRTFAEIGARLLNIGPVAGNQVSDLIKRVHAICNFSVLESFSNNCIEAWINQTPLVCTDADWARSACGTAATYVNPEDTVNSALTLQILIEDNNFRETKITQGNRQLSTYNTPKSKFDHYMSVIDSISNNNRQTVVDNHAPII